MHSVSVSIKLLLFIIVFTATGIGLYFLFDDLHSPPPDYSTIDVSGRVGSVIVIDAGHGGMDGGAVADDGTLEKDLNLIIAKDVAQILKYNGFRVILTRETDTMLGSGEAGKVKRADLNERLRIAEEGADNIFVSIHMNKYPDSRPHGLQVYYSKNNGKSRDIAETVRATVVTTLQPDNKREVKAAGSEIFILNRATVPAVLIECGFISNADELSSLKDEKYRRQLSSVIAAAIMNSTNK